MREARKLGQKYIATEHILLGLARQKEGVAARVLLDVGADSEKVGREPACCPSLAAATTSGTGPRAV